MAVFGEVAPLGELSGYDQSWATRSPRIND